MNAPDNSPAPEGDGRSPWPALWALVVGFFMILVDTTIVSVANPAIKEALDPESANLDRIVWVTSAYLLAYAVPLLVMGRLGDRFGPKIIYLIGLAVFTVSSLLCGLSSDLTMLIIARALQGFGAAMMSPQTMAVITRLFPAHRRGVAMGLWGATAGVATLVGPLAGGVLVTTLSWEWIFFINIPIGIIGFILAVKLVPRFEQRPHRFDILGVVLSGVGLFSIVFALQEGEAHNWGLLWGPIPVWGLFGFGVAMLILFVWTQARSKVEPLVPLELFRDRNFTVSNIGIACVSLASTSMALPLMFYAQLGLGVSAAQASLIMIPMAIASGIFAPFIGGLLDRVHPRMILMPALLLVGLGYVAFGLIMTPDTNLLLFLIPSVFLGIGTAGMWGPLSTTAARDIEPRLAGAGSGVYNTTRMIGSVVGSAGIAALMQARLEAHIPSAANGDVGLGSEVLADSLRAGFSSAMAESMLLPIAATTVALIAVAFMKRPVNLVPAGTPRPPRRSARSAQR